MDSSRQKEADESQKTGFSSYSLDGEKQAKSEGRCRPRAPFFSVFNNLRDLNVREMRHIQRNVAFDATQRSKTRSCRKVAEDFYIKCAVKKRRLG
jgi:hypothetical protein